MPDHLPAESPVRHHLIHYLSFPAESSQRDWKYLLHPRHVLSYNHRPSPRTCSRNYHLSLQPHTRHWFPDSRSCVWLLPHNQDHPTSSDVHQISSHWLLRLPPVLFRRVPVTAPLRFPLPLQIVLLLRLCPRSLHVWQYFHPCYIRRSDRLQFRQIHFFLLIPAYSHPAV